jgi:WhiB family transcriptional regulator, redox-sensing transcriptional regulator
VSSWRKFAACAGMDISLFFPREGGRGSGSKAKKICEGCPVREACLECAIELDCTGIWGGMSYDERQDYVSRIVSGAA